MTAPAASNIEIEYAVPADWTEVTGPHDNTRLFQALMNGKPVVIFIDHADMDAREVYSVPRCSIQSLCEDDVSRSVIWEGESLIELFKQLDDRLCECGNCDWTGYESEIDEEIVDFWSRVSPGETMPMGDCPECGALCHLVCEPAPVAPAADNAAELNDLREFIRTAARLVKDQEVMADGTEFDMANDDAVETLHRLIEDARALWAKYGEPDLPVRPQLAVPYTIDVVVDDRGHPKRGHAAQLGINAVVAMIAAMGDRFINAINAQVETEIGSVTGLDADPAWAEVYRELAVEAKRAATEGWADPQGADVSLHIEIGG